MKRKIHIIYVKKLDICQFVLLQSRLTLGSLCVLQVNDKEKLGAKLSDDDKSTITEALDKAISWLEGHQEADTEEFKEKKKEVEAVVQPIISKLYEGAGGAPPPSGEEEDDSERDEL